MAQVPKVAAAPTAPSAISTRGATTRVSLPSGQGALEELSPTAATSFDAAPFEFHEERHATSDSGSRDQRRPQPRFPGVIEAPSQAFAQLLEYEAPIKASAGDISAPRERVFLGLVAKAVRIYESNAEVIHGTKQVPGTEVSLTL